MDYSEINQLHMENERLTNELTNIKKDITNIAPYQCHINEFLMENEAESYEDDFNENPYETKTKDLKDHHYKILRIIMDFFNYYSN
tara:strand:- start:3919 stop:4176 length:258 start_codon:yes stop_codon:yes gene_type:complete